MWVMLSAGYVVLATRSLGRQEAAPICELPRAAPSNSHCNTHFGALISLAFIKIQGLPLLLTQIHTYASLLLVKGRNGTGTEEDEFAVRNGKVFEHLYGRPVHRRKQTLMAWRTTR